MLSEADKSYVESLEAAVGVKVYATQEGNWSWTVSSDPPYFNRGYGATLRAAAQKWAWENGLYRKVGSFV